MDDVGREVADTSLSLSPEIDTNDVGLGLDVASLTLVAFDAVVDIVETAIADARTLFIPTPVTHTVDALALALKITLD